MRLHRFLLLALTAAAVQAPAASAQAQAPAVPALSGPAGEAGEPVVIGRSFRIESRMLHGSRRVNVYLAPHYGDPGRTFPILFLLDGGIGEDFHHITGLVAISSAYGATEEMIVVGIEGVDRRHDLTSPSQDPEDHKLAPTAGGSFAYRRFLLDELKPWVAARYGRQGRTILMGESLAGLFVVETALREPAAFSDYVAISPSLWWDRQSLSREAALELHKPAYEGRRLWLALADEGSYSRAMQEGMDRLLAALRTARPAGFTWTFTPFPGETHATIYHPAARAAIRALFAVPPR
jgi:predicted alpha/beta superfamily hydrolase